MTTIAVALIAIACSVGLVFLLRNVRLGNRRLANDYLVLAITLIATFVGVTLALVLSEGREQSRIHRRCTGILDAARSTAAEAARNSGSAVAAARDAYEENFDNFRGTSEPRPFEPTPESMLPAEKVLPMLLQDSEVFDSLSEPFRETLPSLLTWSEWDFSQQKDLSGFAARLAEAEHAWLRWEELTRCLSIELKYQDGELDSDEVERELDNLSTWWWREFSRIAVEIGGVPLPDSMLGLPDEGSHGDEMTKEPN